MTNESLILAGSGGGGAGGLIPMTTNNDASHASRAHAGHTPPASRRRGGRREEGQPPRLSTWLSRRRDVSCFTRADAAATAELPGRTLRPRPRHAAMSGQLKEMKAAGWPPRQQTLDRPIHKQYAVMSRP